MAKVYDYFDMSILPQEYLPDDYTGPNAGTEKHIVGKFHISIFIHKSLAGHI